MLEDKEQRWSINDNCGNAIYTFKRALGEQRPFIYVLYRRVSYAAGSFHHAGVTVHLIQTREIIHDNELYAFTPGEQYLLAYWANGTELDQDRLKFPIRISTLEEARMTPIEPIYDADGNEAGWRMRPQEDPNGSPATPHVENPGALPDDAALPLQTNLAGNESHGKSTPPNEDHGATTDPATTAKHDHVSTPDSVGAPDNAGNTKTAGAGAHGASDPPISKSDPGRGGKDEAIPAQTSMAPVKSRKTSGRTARSTRTVA